MNEFLKTRDQITQSTNWLIENNYTTHPISCKDWELAIVTKELQDGDLLDMGADGSFVLHNAVKKGIKGRKVGVDLAEVTGINKADGVEYYKQDLMNTNFENEEFDTIVSCSVIEHEVDFKRFAKECCRLLKNAGSLYVSFDYFDPKPDSSQTKLYALDWNILNRHDVLNLILALAINRLFVTSEIDWSLQDAVINDSYCSPVKNVSYTFGMFKFIKVNP